MAKAIKGCINEACIAREKKIAYRENDLYCSKCGEPLVYVCKDCWMQLEDNKKRYCARCDARRRDQRDRLAETAIAKAAGATTAVAGTAKATGIKAVDNVKSKLSQGKESGDDAAWTTPKNRTR